jgi:hypothetical protein
MPINTGRNALAVFENLRIEPVWTLSDPERSVPDPVWTFPVHGRGLPDCVCNAPVRDGSLAVQDWKAVVGGQLSVVTDRKASDRD